MKVLVIGSGGREHAIAWKLAQSAAVSQVSLAPGNSGAPQGCLPVRIPQGGDLEAPASQEALAAWARTEGIALSLVGPEGPLAAGLVDRFRAQGLPVLGPDQKAAQLEASKAFSKDFMKKYGVRAAPSRSFGDYKAARSAAAAHFRSLSAPPLVIKADGLAAGKGVVVALSQNEAEAALRAFMLLGVLGDAGRTVVLEEFIPGKEVSVLAAVSVVPGRPGGTILPFVSARDHKRRFDGNLGPNTGGMGAIAPAPDFSPAAQEDFLRAILSPTLQGIQSEGFDYRGFIFFGLMVQGERCFLLEYNVRLGDPETQAVLPLMDSDFAALCRAVLDGSLGDFPLKWRSGAVCAPVAVAGGYPGPYRKGEAVQVDQEALARTGAALFAGGVEAGAEGLRTAGGRVLSVSAWGEDGEQARVRAYEALGAVRFSSMDYRKDIGR